MEDDDPAGGAADDEGEPDESRGLPLPVYGINQEHDPVNAREVWENWWYHDADHVCRPRGWQ